MTPVVFLDRDGVINENRQDHVKSWTEFRFLPGAIEAIVRLTRAGLRVFVVTNQAAISRGLLERSTLERLHLQMVSSIEARGGRIDAVIYCPHRSEEACDCRKPRPGLLLQTVEQFGIDPRQAVMVGDALTDIDAGRAAGFETILVLTGRGSDQFAKAIANGRADFLVASDLLAAANLILQLPLLFHHSRLCSLPANRRARCCEPDRAAPAAPALGPGGPFRTMEARP